MRENKRVYGGIIIILMVLAGLFSNIAFSQPIEPRHPENLASPIEITGLLLTSRVDASKLALVYSTIFMIISQYYVDTAIVEFYNYGLNNRASIDFYNSSYSSIAIQVDMSVVPTVGGIIGGFQPGSSLYITYNETIRDEITRNESLDQLMKLSVLLNIFAGFIYSTNTTISGLNMLNDNIKPKIIEILQNMTTIPETNIILWGLIQGCTPLPEIIDNTPYGDILQGNASIIFLNGIDPISQNLTSYCNSLQYQVKLNVDFLSAMLMILGIDVFSVSISNKETGWTGYERIFVFPIVNVTEKELLTYVLSVLSGETILPPIGYPNENNTLNNISEYNLSKLIQIIESGNKTDADNALAIAYKLLENGAISKEDYMEILQKYKEIYGEPPEGLDITSEQSKDDVVLDLDKILKSLENYQRNQEGRVEINNPPSKLPVFPIPISEYQIIKIITLLIAAILGIGFTMAAYNVYKKGDYEEILFIPRILYGKPPYQDESRNALWCYWAIVRILSMKGYPKYEWETPREYLERVKDRLNTKYFQLLEYLTYIYEAIKYGETFTGEQYQFSAEKCTRMLRRLMLEWRVEKSGST